VRRHTFGKKHTTMNIWEVLILFFAFQAIVFALLFTLKGGRARTANRIFSLFLMLFAFNLIFNVLYWSRIDLPLLVSLAYTYYIPIALYGGIFFLYVRTLTTYRPVRWLDLIHFFPILLVIYQYGDFMIMSSSTKLELYRSGEYIQHINVVSWGTLALALCMAGYAIASYLRFVKHFQKDPDLLIWLKVICAAFFVFSLSHVTYTILADLYVISNEYDYFITFFMIVFISLVTYFAFMYAHVFNGLPVDKLIPFMKYEKTGLSENFSLELKRKLQEIMKEQKPYLDPEVRLDSLAALLDISRHHASQIINQHFSAHFYDFINKYRIDDAEQLLRDPDSSLSITDVAYQTGFNNRISFYKAFKKHIGMTPSEYRDHSMASL